MGVILEELTDLRCGWQPQDYSERLCLTEPRVAIASDVHVPYHDEKLLARFLETAASSRADAIVWLGDLMDMHTHSSWGQDDLTTLFTRELDITSGIIRLADRYVPQQYWSFGNHEARFMRRLGQQVGMVELARMMGLQDLLENGRLVLSDNPTLDYLPADGPAWMLTHPADYGSKPLDVPGALADLHHVNVVAAHAHHWGRGMSPSGEYECIESGGLFEPKLIKYVQHRMTRHRKWCKGFVLLDHGEPHLVRG